MVENTSVIEKKGQCITFYSYKGGVGRTMALVNLACLLVKQNFRVLAIDWDVEAPGLHQFFKVANSHLGLIDLVDDIVRYTKNVENNNEKSYWEFFEHNTDRYIEKDITPKSGTRSVTIDIMKAGKFGTEEYSKKLNGINWQEIYSNSPYLFRIFAGYLESKYDFILIDSRTGLADSGGITTMLMPQKLVLVFALNNQNIDGVVDIAEQVIDYRANSTDFRSLDIYPLPSRVENTISPDLAKWIESYTTKFENLFTKKHFLDNCNLTGYFDKCFIPYYPIHAHGENIPAIVEQTTNSSFISYYYSNFLSVILQDIAPWEVKSKTIKIASNNINPVVFISYSWDSESHKEWVLNLAKTLMENGIDVILDRFYLHVGSKFSNIIEEGLLKADAIIAVFTPNYRLKAENQSGGVGHEYSIIKAEFYNQQSEKRFIPILREGTPNESVPSFVREFLWVDFTEDSKYEAKCAELIEGLLELPSVAKPELGKLPNNQIDKLNSILKQEKSVFDFLIDTLNFQNKIIDLTTNQHSEKSRVYENSKPSLKNLQNRSKWRIAKVAAICVVFVSSILFLTVRRRISGDSKAVDPSSIKSIKPNSPNTKLDSLLGIYVDFIKTYGRGGIVSICKFEYDSGRHAFIFDGVSYDERGNEYSMWRTISSEIDSKERVIRYSYKRHTLGKTITITGTGELHYSLLSSSLTYGLFSDNNYYAPLYVKYIKLNDFNNILNEHKIYSKDTINWPKIAIALMTNKEVIENYFSETF